MKSSAKNLAVFLVAILAANLQAAQVTTVIDDWTGSQSLAAENTSVTNTISSPGALGGFRTASLTSLGNEPDEPTRLVVSTNNNRFNLTTPEGPTPTFVLTSGGAGGSAGPGNSISGEDDSSTFSPACYPSRSVPQTYPATSLGSSPTPAITKPPAREISPPTFPAPRRWASPSR